MKLSPRQRQALEDICYDEIIISTLPTRVSRWLRLDLVSKARALGLPVAHVEAPTSVEAPAGVGSS